MKKASVLILVAAVGALLVAAGALTVVFARFLPHRQPVTSCVVKVTSFHADPKERHVGLTYDWSASPDTRVLTRRTVHGRASDDPSERFVPPPTHMSGVSSFHFPEDESQGKEEEDWAPSLGLRVVVGQSYKIMPGERLTIYHYVGRDGKTWDFAFEVRLLANNRDGGSGADGVKGPN